MKKLKLMGVIAALVTGCFFSENIQAQNLVSVQLSQNDHNQVIAQNSSGGTWIAPGQNNIYSVVPGTTTYPSTDPGPATCIDRFTPAIAAWMQSEANACCCRVYYCVMRSNCAYWLMYADPSNPALCPAPMDVYQPNQAFQAFQFQ